MMIVTGDDDGGYIPERCEEKGREVCEDLLIRMWRFRGFTTESWRWFGVEHGRKDGSFEGGEKERKGMTF
jgi:hypothetical protein